MRIYLDTEYCYPGMMRGTPRPTASDKRQIVQIAAIIFDNENEKEIDSFDQLAVPTYETAVGDFFTELTGITQDDIDTKAISFNEAFLQFREFCGDIEIWTFDKDEEVLRQNCNYTAIDWPFETPFTRVKPKLNYWGINPNDYSSGILYRAVGLEMDGHVHNALHDVRSMARSIYRLEHQQ